MRGTAKFEQHVGHSNVCIAGWKLQGEASVRLSSRGINGPAFSSNTPPECSTEQSSSSLQAPLQTWSPEGLIDPAH